MNDKVLLGLKTVAAGALVAGIESLADLLASGTALDWRTAAVAFLLGAAAYLKVPHNAVKVQ